MHMCMYSIHLYVSTYKCDVHVHVITCMYTCLRVYAHVYGDENAVYTQLPGRLAISGR